MSRGTSTIVASQTDAGGRSRSATAIVHVVAADQSGPTPTVPPDTSPPGPPASQPTPSASPSGSPSVAPSPSPSASPSGSPDAASSPSPSAAEAVSPTASGSDGGGTPSWALVALAGAIAVAAAGGVAWLWRRRAPAG